MAYVKQTWQTGDVVTSAKLNHMEDGIAEGGGAMVVPVDENWECTKTWNEIKTAVLGGIPVYILADGSEDESVEINMMPVLYIEHVEETYDIHAVATGVTPQMMIFSANSADGYPAFVSH